MYVYFLEEVILPPGEKIRRIRGYLGLKQYEITGGKITRNLISYIENGKTKLVENTAKIIVDNMNEWAEKKKIPLNIDVEYIMLDEISQANILLEKYIEKLKKYMNEQNKKFENELLAAKKILKDWDITEKKAKIFEICGEYYYRQEEFDESYISYLKALENYIRISNNLKTAFIYSELAKCVIWMKNYQEAINLNKYAFMFLKENNIEDMSIVKKILFNNSLAYRRINKYDESLALLKKLENEMADHLTEEQHLNILLSKGNCYFKKEEYTVAEKIYDEIMDITNKKNYLEIKSMTLKNLSEIYVKQNKIEKAIENLKKSIKIRLDNNIFCNNSFYIVNLYLSLGRLYNQINEFELAEEYLLKASKEDVKIKDSSLQIDIYKELMNNYMLSNNDKTMDKLIEDLKEKAYKYNKINQIKDIFFQAAHYYINKNVEKSEKLLKFSLEIIA